MSTNTTHIETFKVEAAGSGWSTKVNVSDTQWKIEVDEPTEDGGSNTGPNPMQYFTAALAACENEQAQVIAEEMGLELGGITIDLEVDLDLAGFMGMEQHSNGSYKAVRLSVKVAGNIAESQLKVLSEKVDARCPILALLRTSGCAIDSTWVNA
jgi:uncharacterized OsmC-like protein